MPDKTIILVFTHGDKLPGADPGLSPKGKEDVQQLQPLPDTPSTVICGTGKRHRETAEALGLTVTDWNPVAGCPDSTYTRADGKKVVVLADGTEIEPEQYTGRPHLKLASFALIEGLPNFSVLVGGRDIMKMLGQQDAKSGAVYQIELSGTKITQIKKLAAHGEIDKVLEEL